MSMSNYDSDDDMDAYEERDEDGSDEADDDDGDEEEDGPEYAISGAARIPQGSTRTSNVPSSTSPQWDLYSYGVNMTDKQKREQDERNFANAVGKERKSKSIADSKRRIHFDAESNLQHSDAPGSSGWQPAVFHHWIRRELSEASNRRGSYVFPRKAGHEPGNVTSFVESQRQWGTQREHYAPIMFQYEPPRNRTAPNPGPWRHNGRLVIDYWLRPLQDFQEIPQVLSSEYEGGFMEPSQRRNKRIKHADFRQRMPPFIIRKGEPVPVTSANNLAKRNRYFRNRAGAIPWNKCDKASEKIKEYIDSVHAQQRPGRRGNDTRGCQDLSPEQIQKLFEINAGSRSRVAGPQPRGHGQRGPNPPGYQPTTSTRVPSLRTRTTKRKYVSSEEGSPPPAQRGSSSLNSFNFPSIGGVLGIPTRPKASHTAHNASSSKPPKKKLETRTTHDDSDGEANSSSSSSFSSSEDYNDRLYLVPETQTEIESIQRLLQPTLAHYYDLTGFHIQDWDTTATYAEQVAEIERAMHRVMERLGRHSRPDLLRIDEFNEERAVWNLPWDEATYGEPMDLSGDVGEQLDGAGRRWRGGRWV